MNIVMRRKNGKLIEYTINGKPQPLTEPTVRQKAVSITGAATRVVKSIFGGKNALVAGEEQARRLSICATCEFFTGNTCKKCGCHIRFKAKLATEHCPINKW